VDTPTPWRTKLRRAATHLKAFESACAEYLTTANVGFDFERNPAVGSILVRLRADAEPPLELGVIIGDFLHNARSALDAIAWETCQRAGVSPSRETDVYFPIGLKGSDWGSLAGSVIPNVTGADRDVFKSLQPWYWDEQAAQMLGETIDPERAARHPLRRLHDLATIDRHRVPHPILARAGHTWLGSPEGVQVTAMPADPWPVQPGGVVLEWKVDPPGAVVDVFPDGEAILVLSEDAAPSARSALQELQSMWGAVEVAVRTVEIEVLRIVTAGDMDELAQLHRDYEEARDALEDLRYTPHTLDEQFAERFRALRDARDEARDRLTLRRRDLFDDV
jgi:hypothetical protein